MRRTRGREVALQVLYQKDLNPGIGQRQISTFIRRRLKHTPHLLEYVKELVSGVSENQDELDKRLQLSLENWKIHRMPVLDRNIMRIGLFEILTGKQSTPPTVAVNEAVDLAKRYGSIQSGKFINGILDQFLPGHPAAFQLGDPIPVSEAEDSQEEPSGDLSEPAQTDTGQSEVSSGPVQADISEINSIEST